MQEIEGTVPEQLREWWSPAVWSLHSAAWWRRHRARTGILEVLEADAMPEGWQLWPDWHRATAPDIEVEISAVEADPGRTLGYVSTIARRVAKELEDPIVSLPAAYTPAPLLRSDGI